MCLLGHQLAQLLMMVCLSMGEKVDAVGDPDCSGTKSGVAT